MCQVIGAIDHQTRCKHYHTDIDIIAIKFKCCNTYYGCYYCHEEAADHKHMVWPRNEWETKAILCGSCDTELTINQYMNSDYTCPTCQAAFNPRCQNHYHLYFAL